MYISRLNSSRIAPPISSRSTILPQKLAGEVLVDASAQEISCHGWAGKKVWKWESWRGLSSFESTSFRWRPAIEEKEENSGPAFGATSTRIYVIVARENPRLDAELPASSSLGIHSTRLFFRASESVDIVSFLLYAHAAWTPGR